MNEPETGQQLDVGLKIEEEAPKISEMLEMAGFMVAGLAVDKAAQAARSARHNRESRMPQIAPSSEAFQREWEWLRGERMEAMSRAGFWTRIFGLRDMVNDGTIAG